MTKSGSIVIWTNPPYTAAQLQEHTWEIHSNSDLIPGFARPEVTPILELDVPWHGIVIHDLPADTLLKAFDGEGSEGIRGALEEEAGVLAKDIRDIRFMCRNGEELQKDQLSIRIMFEDPMIGARLQRNGISLLGSWCRVSKYQPRHNQNHKQPSQPSQPSPAQGLTRDNQPSTGL